MTLLNPENPVYNTIIFYILITCVLLVVKPKFMYCHKTNKFKSFGLEKKQTLFSFPVISISSGILLYLLFLGIEIIHNYLSKSNRN